MKIILAIRFQWMDGNIGSRGTMQYSYKAFSNTGEDGVPHLNRRNLVIKEVITKWAKIKF